MRARGLSQAIPAAQPPSSEPAELTARLLPKAPVNSFYFHQKHKKKERQGVLAVTHLLSWAEVSLHNPD